jgi:hypothetical protein
MITFEQPEPRLYGMPSAELLYDSIDEVIDTDIEPFGVEGPVEIEEFDVHPARYHLDLVIPPEGLLEHIREEVEDYGEISESPHPWFNIADPELLAAADQLLDLIASKVTWRQARNRLATHTVGNVDGVYVVTSITPAPDPLESYDDLLTTGGTA